MAHVVELDLAGRTLRLETGRVAKQADGSVLFRATVSGLEEVRFWVLQWGPGAKVRRPPELIDEIRRMAQAVNDCYAQLAPKQ